MFDRESRPTITESVVESADSAVKSADYWSRPTGNWPSGYGPLLLTILQRFLFYSNGHLNSIFFLRAIRPRIFENLIHPSRNHKCGSIVKCMLGNIHKMAGS